jgi:hypothetical protein
MYTKFLVRNRPGKRSFGRSRRRLEDTIMVILKVKLSLGLIKGIWGMGV